MNVWLVKTGEPVPTDGNVRLYRTGTLAKALADAGHQVTWWTSSFYHQRQVQRCSDTQSVQIAPNYCLKLIRYPTYKSNVSPRRLTSDIVGSRLMLRYMQLEEKPDIIICSFPTIECANTCKLYSQRKGVPVILDVRDLWPDVFETLLPPKRARQAKPFIGLLRRRTRLAFQQAFGIVGISQKYLDFGLNYAGRKRNSNDQVFPLGYPQQVEIQDQSITEKLLAEMGIHPDRYVAWFVGIFGSSYDLHTVIEAARILHTQGDSSIHFVLSGDGDQMESLKNQAEGLTNILMTGWVDKSRLAAIGARANVGLMAYRSVAPQGLPNKLFEYLSSSLPVISSLRGEAEAAISKMGCGISIHPEDPHELVNALLHYRDNPEKGKANGRSGYEEFCREYSSEIIYPKFIRYIENLAGNDGKLQP